MVDLNKNIKETFEKLPENIQRYLENQMLSPNLFDLENRRLNLQGKPWGDFERHKKEICKLCNDSYICDESVWYLISILRL